jgi:hypothetical protein
MPDDPNQYVVVANKKILAPEMELPQSQLKFYIENPRVYSRVRSDGVEPSQEEIEEMLRGMEHVKQLAMQIRDNGGLLEPIIVLAGSLVVLEGNSRLAAYRILSDKQPLKWAKIRARVLPADTSGDDIFAMLGIFHISGKKTDWSPFEQAGYLWRCHVQQDKSIEVLAGALGLGQKAVTHLIDVYKFMREKGETTVDRWSFFDEYLKARSIRRAREEHPELDDIVVQKIRSGEIPKALEIREGLRKITDAKGKVLERFVAGKRNFRLSVEAALDRGLGDTGIRRIMKFKEWIVTTDAHAEIKELDGESRKAALFELKKIKKHIDKLVELLDTSK